MRYRTIIEIVSDAADRNEAAEMAGDYLSGNVMNGVEMKCRTRPVANKARNVAAVLAISAIFIVTALSIANVKSSPVMPHMISANDAIQVPLSTFDANIKSLDFKKDWQEKHNKAAINFIKR